MSWPSDQDYNEALQDLALNCGDALLKQCSAVRNPLGLLMPYSGNFADVYEVRGPDGRKWAVKCFKRNTPGLHARYQQIDAHLRSAKLPFTVPFAYVEQGLRIRGQWSPLVRMEWVEGQRLNDFVTASLEQPQRLDQLAELWPKVSQRLQAAQVAHADLQHGNVLLVPREDGALSLKLIDYDGMYVPAFAGQRSPELGHACFQHPQRARDKLFNAEVDRFSHLVIFTALRCLRVDGQHLWQRYENGDNLLFRESDFAGPAQSELLKELWALSSRSAHAMVGRLVLATQQPLAQAPWLHEIVQGREIAPLAPADEARVNELLRGNAAAPPVPAALQGGGPRGGSQPAGSRPTPLPVPLPVPGGSRGAPQPIPLGAAGNTPLPVPVPPVASAVPTGPLRPVLVQPGVTPTPSARAAAPPRGTAAPAWLAALRQHYRGNRLLWHAGLAGAAALLLLLGAVLFYPRGEQPTPIAATPPGEDAEEDEQADSNDAESSANPETAEPTTPATAAAWVDFREQRTLEGHAGIVRSVAFSPDGRTLASGCEDETIKLWDATTGTLRQTLEAHAGWVVSVAFSPDGRMLASGSDDRTTIWDAATGALNQTFDKHSGWVVSVAFSFDGRTLASGIWDGTIELSGAATGAPRQTLAGHTSTVHSVAYSPDRRTLATGSWDRTIKLWDAATGALQQTLEGHADSVLSVAFSPDGRTLASGSVDDTIKLWNVATGALQQTLAGHSDDVRSVAFSLDGRTLASGSLDDTIKLWDATTGELRQTLAEHAGDVYSVAFSPDGRTLASGGDDATIKLWSRAPANADTPTSIASVFPPQYRLQQTLLGHSDVVERVAIRPDGRVVASGGRDRSIKLWDAQSGELLQTLVGDEGGVFSLAFSGDGRLLASGGDDTVIRLWDGQTFDPRGELTGHTSRLRALVFLPDGQLVSGAEDRTIRFWDLDTQQSVAALDAQMTVTALAVLPDGQTLAVTGDEGDVQLLRLGGTTERQTLGSHPTASIPGGGGHAVAFSPDGRLLASCGFDHLVKIWDVATGALRHTLAGHGMPVLSLAFHPGGRALASGSMDQKIILWDVETGQQLQTLTGHTEWVSGLAFSADGTLLASGSHDDTVKLWKTKPLLLSQFRLQQTLLGHSDVVECVAIRPDGRVVASGGWDQSLKLWDAQTGELRQTLLGDKGWVVRLAFSSDGRLLASGGDDTVIRLWDAESFELLRELPGHERRIRGLQFTRDGRTLISGCEDKSMRFWDVATGTERAAERLQIDTEVTSLALSPTERRLAAAGYDGTVHLWDLETRMEQPRFGVHGGGVGAVAFSPHGELLASAGHDSLVKIWDVTTGELRHTLAGHGGPVISLAFHPGGRVVASGSMDAQIILWDVETGEQLQALTGHTEWVSGLAFSADGTLLASSSHDDSVKLWTTRAGGKLQYWEFQAFEGHSGLVHDIKTTLLGIQIASCGADGFLRFREIPSGKLLTEWRATDHPEGVSTIAPTTNPYVVATAGFDGDVKIWDFGQQALIGTWPAHDNWATALACSPDGATLVSGGWDNKLKFWDLNSYQGLDPQDVRPTRTIDVGAYVDALTYSPDGTLVAAGTGAGQVLLYGASDATRDRPLAQHNGPVHALDFSPDGQTLASAGDDGQIRLTNVRTGEAPIIEAHAQMIRVVAYSPDGSQIVSGSDDGTLKLWDAATRQLVQTLSSAHGAVFSADFSFGGQVLITGHADGAIVYWELRATAEADEVAAVRTVAENDVPAVPTAPPRPNFQERLQLQADANQAFAAAFSLDGQQIVTGGEAGIARQWDAQSGAMLSEPTDGGLPSPIHQLSFHPDGSRVALTWLNFGIFEWEVGGAGGLQVVPGHAVVHDLAYGATGLLAAAGLGGSVGLHDGSLKLRDIQADTIFIHALAFSADGSQLFTTMSDPVGLNTWDVASGELLQTWDCAASQLEDITELALSPDGRYFAVGGTARVALLDGRTGEVLRTWAATQAVVDHGISGLSFSPDGRWLISATFNGEVKIWSVPEGELLQELPQGPQVNGVEFSPVGRQLVVAGKDGLVRVWTHVDEAGAALPDDPDAPPAGTSPAGARFAPAPLPAEVAAAATDPRVPGEYRVARTMTHAQVAGETFRNVTALAYSPDGRLLASGSEDKTVRIWDPATGAQRHELADHAQGILAIAFHPDCRTVASGGYDRSVKLWDAVTGELLQSLAGHDDWVSGLAFSPDGTVLASASDDTTVKLWNVATGELVQTLAGHAGSVKGVAFTPDGRRLVSVSYDQTVKVWNLIAGAAERDFSGHAGGVSALAISPDGALLASGGLDKSVILWELATGLQREKLEGYEDFPQALAFSPNGQTLAVAAWDASLQLLNPLTGAQRQKLPAGASRLIEVAWSPAGRTLATGAENGTITLWEAVP